MEIISILVYTSGYKKFTLLLLPYGAKILESANHPNNTLLLFTLLFDGRYLLVLLPQDTNYAPPLFPSVSMDLT